jgi:hypothetical protein
VKLKSFPLFALLTLSACDTGAWKRQEDLMARGWAEAPEVYHPPQIYCYRTLAGNECFREPLPNEDDRLDACYAGNSNASPYLLPPPQHSPQSIDTPRRVLPLKEKTLKPRQSRKSRPTIENVKKLKTSSDSLPIEEDEKYQRKRYMTKIVQE